ncbi:MAG: hypothetical protein ACRECZ_05530 [Methylocella sp.]
MAVVLANKMASIAWAVMTKEENYRAVAARSTPQAKGRREHD